ncbi:MAG: NAD(P)/FAD-dependent oxidoreductase [cyanobacterium endosymbiont of Rhopalodia musculus]|uniref:NAD(P)/FAD-dependent oxidoreductase n=1 Tax=cyanobacterium endosymbiont of Epithemia clementina EcSB TaxID=3034674 RepID=UPI0024811C54|nr:NAD(P)/FAD-dependent oxidoreductase [cyanobacterium endosymbiont of Epithemia clementina EcSB]WGT68045.1 NAD(P)/FAD-dependent oxidoreductase [cyanobacterium endosymbiont of Epithemia clementina EcSB]
MSEQALRICILGGGFGGLYTALRLSQFPWTDGHSPEIILIDQKDHFLFTPLLYELITGEMQSWEIAPCFEELLNNTRIRFHQGCVTAINVETQHIELDNRHSLSYDKLVLAMGGKTPLDKVLGSKDYGICFRSLQDAYRIKERLRLLEVAQAEKIRVAVVGGGSSGVELACKLADHLGEIGRIRLVERKKEILSNSPGFNFKAVQDALEKRRVWIDLETEVSEITSDSLSLCYKGRTDTIPVDLVICTVGTQVLDLIQDLPLKHSEQGLITVNPELQVIDHPEIYALGDLANCKDATGQQIPQTAQTAFQQSDYCAWNLWASITRRPLLPFRYQASGGMLALGINNATLNGLGMELDGPLAYLTRRLIYLYRLPTFKHQLSVGLSWMIRPLVEGLSD